MSTYWVRRSESDFTYETVEIGLEDYLIEKNLGCIANLIYKHLKYISYPSYLW
jgi:hypothetical protein